MDKPEALSSSLKRRLCSFYEIKNNQKRVKYPTELLEEIESLFGKNFFSTGTPGMECNQFDKLQDYASCSVCGDDLQLPPGNCQACGAELELELEDPSLQGIT